MIAPKAGRALLVALTVLVLTAVSAPTMAQDADGLVYCGQHIELDIQVRDLPPDVQIRQHAPGKRATNIILDAGPGLLGNANALAVWNEVVADWEAILGDNVTVTIEADMAALPPNVLGSTGISAWIAGFNTIRNAMVAEAGLDESFLNGLPTLAQFNYVLPPGLTFPTSNHLGATKANLRALGFDMSFDNPNPDATITFSNSFAFDYDRSNGITAGRYDFYGVAFHELGHALGFVSRNDYVDYLVDNGLTDDIHPYTMDLLRLLPGEGAGNFTAAVRQLTTGNLSPVQVSYLGNGDFGMSLGVNQGDGRQASHWKSDELSGTYIGVMDATASAAQLLYPTTEDIRMFSLLGWDVNFSGNDCDANGMDDTIDLAWGGADVDGNGILDACEPDCNSNGLPDAWEITQGISPDCNANNVPDACDISGGTSNDVNSNGIPDECEPDCNSNGVPDSWEVSEGLADDVNSNGIPDDCEPDCNNNGIPDSWDISQGTSNDLNNDGVPDECDPTAVGETPRLGYRAEAAPNPFNPGTTIHFDLPEAGRAQIVIYDVTGRRVRELVDRAYVAGRHSAEWNGRSDGGAEVASGVYYAVYRANGQTAQVKLTLLK